MVQGKCCLDRLDSLESICIINSWEELLIVCYVLYGEGWYGIDWFQVDILPLHHVWRFQVNAINLYRIWWVYRGSLRPWGTYRMRPCFGSRFCIEDEGHTQKIAWAWNQNIIRTCSNIMNCSPADKCIHTIMYLAANLVVPVYTIFSKTVHNVPAIQH